MRSAARGGERARGRAAKAREGHTGQRTWSGHAEDGGRETEAAGTAVRNSANRAAHRGESGKPRGPCGTERPHRVCADEGTARGSDRGRCAGPARGEQTDGGRKGQGAGAGRRLCGGEQTPLSPSVRAVDRGPVRAAAQGGERAWGHAGAGGEVPAGAAQGQRAGRHRAKQGGWRGRPRGRERKPTRASGAKERGPPTLPTSAKAPSLFLYFPFSGTRTGPPPPWPGAWPAAAAGGLR